VERDENMPAESWIDVGASTELSQRPVQQVTLGKTKIALTYQDGKFGAISGVCNHAGGPLVEGTLSGDYVVCPWHYWKYHCRTGEGEPGFAADHPCLRNGPDFIGAGREI
jgi:nitrite reductase/ring-hydroxylating ferredoxin subunit